MEKKTRIKVHVIQSTHTWGIPALYIIIAIALGFLMPRLDARFSGPSGLFTSSTAVSLLTAIASGMLSFTGFVFSMTFLMAQVGTSTYSPRLMRYFLEHPVILHSSGIFIATFVYALIALVVIDFDEEGVASNLTLLCALAGVMGSIIFFLALIQHIGSLKITNVLYNVGDKARDVIGELYPDRLDDKNPSSPARKMNAYVDFNHTAELPPTIQKVVYHGGPLAILGLDVPRLTQLASSAGGLIRVLYSTGDYVSNDSVLLEVRGPKKISENKLMEAIDVGRQRNIDQDLKYAIRILVDIAIRALSTGINDPTTAVQALDQLDDLLLRIGQRDLDTGYSYDKDGILRLLYPTPTWEDYIDLSLHEIRFFGANSLSVMRRLRALLEDLHEAVPESRKALVKEHIDREVASIDRSFADIYDRMDARQSDRQGIGLTREPDDGEDDD